jgi:hypothetical protein
MEYEIDRSIISVYHRLYTQGIIKSSRTRYLMSRANYRFRIGYEVITLNIPNIEYLHASNTKPSRAPHTACFQKLLKINR